MRTVLKSTKYVNVAEYRKEDKELRSDFWIHVMRAMQEFKAYITLVVVNKRGDKVAVFYEERGQQPDE